MARNARIIGLCSCGCGREHYSKGLAKPCYFAAYQKKRKRIYPRKDDHPGLVRVSVNGWGVLAASSKGSTKKKAPAGDDARLSLTGDGLCA